MKKCKRCIAFGMLFFFLSRVSFALVFNITPQRPLPQTVPEFGKVSAYYYVNNTTNTALTDNFVKTLPPNVTQVTCDPKYCGSTFNLGAKDTPTESCILKLTIKGPVVPQPEDLLVCTQNQSSCDGTSDPLNVALTTADSFIGIGAGNYSNHSSGIFPLLAVSNNQGATWTYPTSIFQNLTTEIDPAFSNGVLSGASCSGPFNNNVCIAPGQWCTGDFCDNSLPLIAVARQNATHWFYPHNVFEDLTTKIDANFTGANFRAGSCFGSGGRAVCMAAGSYTNPTSFFPLISVSHDGGSNWSYPPSVFQNLTQSIDPSFEGGFLLSSSCTKSTCDSVCIAAGNFCTDNCFFQKPLVALSTDKGLTWSYPHDIFKDLTTKIDPDFQDGNFVGSSCTGTGHEATCIASGSFYNKTTVLPFLVLTKNGGTTWSYPAEVFTNLPVVIGHGFIGGVFNAASCTGSKAKAVCIAAGSYFRKGSSFPLLAVTRNGGDTWTYPDFIYTKLKTVVDPEAVGGQLDSASCTGTSTSAICIAGGGYCRKDTTCYPLLALSTNGGKNWSYPPSIYQNLKAIVDPNFQYGFFSDASCTGSAAHNFCIATGQYSNLNATFPLLAFSNDGGNTWSYPSSIFQNLSTIIDPDFAIAQFNKGATTGSLRKHTAKS